MAIPSGSASALSYPRVVHITAGDGRVVRLRAAGVDAATTDAPGLAVINTLGNLIWALYLFAVCAAFVGAYVVLAVRTGIWRIHPMRWIRAMTIAQVLSGVVTVATTIGFAVRGTAGLGVIAVATLGSFIIAQVARGQSRPGETVLTTGPTAREVAFGERHTTPLKVAIYLLAGMPAVLGASVAFGLIHDGDGIPGAVVFLAGGFAVTGLFVFMLRRRLARGRRRHTKPATARAV
jgi:hypothetical protein